MNNIVETTRTWSTGTWSTGDQNSDSISVAITTNDDTNGGHESLRIKIDLSGMDGLRVIQNSSSCVEFAVDGAWEGRAILNGLKELCK